MNVNVSERKGYVIPTASEQWLPFPFAKWLSVSEYTCSAGGGRLRGWQSPPPRVMWGQARRGCEARRSLIPLLRAAGNFQTCQAGKQILGTDSLSPYAGVRNWVLNVHFPL